MRTAFQRDSLERENPYLAAHVLVLKINSFNYLHTSKAWQLPGTCQKYRKTKTLRETLVATFHSGLLMVFTCGLVYATTIKSLILRLLISLAANQICTSSLRFFFLYIVIDRYQEYSFQISWVSLNFKYSAPLSSQIKKFPTNFLFGKHGCHNNSITLTKYQSCQSHTIITVPLFGLWPPEGELADPSRA